MRSKNKDIPLYNSRIIDNYIKLIKAEYSYIDVDELLSFAGMETYQVADEAGWFSQTQINKFQEKLSELTGNKSIAREAGAYAASPDALGTMRRYILGLIGPHNAYELVGKYASKFTKSSTFSSKKISSDRVEIIVKPNEGVTEQPFQCENRLGFWEAISDIFNYKIKNIEHPECIFKGGSACRYTITLEKNLSANISRMRDYISIFFIIIAFVLLFHFSKVVFFTYALACLTIVSLISWVAIKQKTVELKNAVENLSSASESLIEQVNINYENSLLINEIGQALSKENDLDGISSQVLNVLEDRLDYDRGLVLLANKEKTRLVSRAGFGYSLNELSQFMMSSGFHLDKKTSKGVFINCFNQ